MAGGKLLWCHPNHRSARMMHFASRPVKRGAKKANAARRPISDRVG
ncbi:MAG: hypothetical protein HC829_07270 [Bacteroidales bacterium]|nr:hypothetical protein [Bacteroidales bacterium]